MLEWEACYDCFRGEWNRRNKKECRICGELRLPKDSKDTTCDECKADISGKPNVLVMPEPEPDAAEALRYTRLAQLTDPAGDTWSLIGLRASNVKAENIEWLWEHRIPLSKHTIFAGRPGGGKSMVALDIAARVSVGGDWPDGTKNTLGPRNVLYFATEDGIADTLKPRLMAVGADCERVFFPQDVTKIVSATGKKQQVLINLKQHLALLQASLQQTKGVGLVVLDPLTSFIGVNINKDEEVRPLMDKLAKILDSTDATFISIVHHNKRSDVSALEKILGSSSIVGSARAIWDFSRDPDDRDVRHMSLVKLNIDEEPGGMTYMIRTKEIGGIKGAYVEWGEETTENADDILGRQREKGREQREAPAIIAAKLFLKTHLAKGEAKSSGDDGLIERAKLEGISKSSLWRAKKELELSWVKRGNDYYWSLPQEESFIPAEVMEQGM
jgi:putative DNA primase/helicase